MSHEQTLRQLNQKLEFQEETIRLQSMKIENLTKMIVEIQTMIGDNLSKHDKISLKRIFKQIHRDNEMEDQQPLTFYVK